MLQFRARQLFRYMQEIGLLRVIVLLIAITIFLPRLAFELWMKNPYYLAWFWGFILASIHFKRPDYHFLKRLGTRWQWLFCVEYNILSLILIIFFAYKYYWLVSLSLLLEGFILPLIPQRFMRYQIHRKIQWWDSKTFWSPLHFEWISGVRQRFPYVATLWLLGVVFCAFAPVAPIITFLLTLVVVQFYLLCEPKEMVEIFKCSARRFVQWKIAQTLRLFGLLNAPFWIGFLIFNPTYWFVLPVVGFVSALLLTLAVVLKYASYTPNEDLSHNNTLMTMAIMFCFLPPFSFLVNIFWVIRYYRRAVNNMQDYLRNGEKISYG
ncbi:hypothetical protein [uncultured Microscilla sp.]|uniref:hypothetical protein n=1 Tax=uncultured Microscilla sp. TaxID=432653 RepID=UPI00262B90AF|nr:hypothetical protein [uncultured Microscilla sp.]